MHFLARCIIYFKSTKYSSIRTFKQNGCKILIIFQCHRHFDRTFFRIFDNTARQCIFVQDLRFAVVNRHLECIAVIYDVITIIQISIHAVCNFRIVCRI